MTTRPITPPSPPPDLGHGPLFVSPLEAARYLGVSRSAVYRLMDAGALESRRSGRRRLVVTTSLRQYAERLLAEGA